MLIKPSLELAKSNQVVIGSDRPVNLTFTRHPEDTTSFLNATVAITFSIDGQELVSWRLTTASGLTRIKNTSTIQQVAGMIGRSLTNSRLDNEKIDYSVSIEAGGVLQISPEWRGHFRMIK